MSWTLTVDPLAARELGSFSRRGQTYLVRMIYVGLTGYAVWLFGRSAQAGSVSDLAALGRDLFLRFVVLQLVLVPLASAVAASDLVAREARAGTLGLLILTGLSPRGIAWAKWRASMVYAGLLLLAGLPVVAVSVYLGAAGPRELAWSTATTLSLASLAAAMAVRFSSSCETGGRAFFRAILALAGWTCALMLACLPFTLFGVAVISWIHPVFAAVSAVEHPTDPLHAWAWIGAAYVSLMATWVLLRDAGKRIGRRVVAAPRPPKAEHGFGTFVSYYSKLRGTGRPRLVLERGVWDRRPLLWKELATRAMARVGIGWRIALFWSFLAFLSLCWAISNSGRDLEPFYLPGAAFLLYVVGWGSFLFAREREGRRWDLLLSTPTRASEIVGAKLLSGLVAPESISFLVLLALAIAGWSAWAGTLRFVLMGATVLLFLGFAYALAAAASLLCRTPRTAFGAAAGLLAVLVGVLPYVLSLQGDFRSSPWLTGLSPVTMLEELHLRRTLDIAYEAWNRDLDARLLEAAVRFVATYGAASAALVAAMIGVVRRRSGIE